MQPPILQDSVLRDRYVVKGSIGQGGMGRTYKAQDLERFNEICVLKEFIPTSQSPDVITKAKELFQREASTLYQIRHPQIPEFRAIFEADGRLFLVQDYVEGKTFRALMQERRRQGNNFTEAEIITLLKQVLPILSYLHGRNIIHRDVSPENLMLRSQDQLPVLIDFGVVKETATRLQSQILGLPASTMAGKLGYAPPEQMQSGRAYASSDLYALAVTAIVLLTGREPQDLFDDNSLSWRWQQFVNVSPNFAQVINRMLGYKPASRYSSAEEVLQALDIAQASVSSMPTFAVGQAPRPELGSAIAPNTIYAGERILSPQPSPIKNNGGINPLWGVLLVLASGFASWAIASMLFDQGKPPEVITSTSPTPTNEPTSSPSPSPQPTQAIININKELEFASNTNTAISSGRISQAQAVIYRFNAKKGQTMTVGLVGAGFQMTLTDAAQQPIDNRAKDINKGYWQGKLPVDGAYFITVKSSSGGEQSEYSLEVKLEDPEIQVIPKPTNTPEPTISPTPDLNNGNNPNSNNGGTEGNGNRSNIPADLGNVISGTVKPGEAKLYRYTVQEGQTLIVTLKEGFGNVHLDVTDPNGVPAFGRPLDDRAIAIDNTIAGKYEVIITPTSEADSPFAFEVTTK